MKHSAAIEKNTNPVPFVAPRWASVRKTAEYADLGLSKTWRLINDGSIFAIKTGRKVICDLNSVDAYYRNCPRVGRQPMNLEDLTLEADAMGHGNG